ncbi:uncharacterized protein K460DRAFT_60399 [Cucurbitaria berberidis CBS 394.84]|uniref:Uncharacterized protein n=1 Tax=Cucurbitaria berberidis CBS 394.84 TaxID=1168544 RepID=A0A9P4GJS0_9PLEO|nr:uncharacterized protein K460DRAFT_60399 [Cucurbitaria berberidis CBS 394.84]KAF1847558.1 hypothetical protein K460DRAFT_60399 [Cucurbitaria berberidis CBS 394.84]
MLRQRFGCGHQADGQATGLMPNIDCLWQCLGPLGELRLISSGIRHLAPAMESKPVCVCVCASWSNGSTVCMASPAEGWVRMQFAAGAGGTVRDHDRSAATAEQPWHLSDGLIGNESRFPAAKSCGLALREGGG